jgi:predicted acyltransferase
MSEIPKSSSSLPQERLVSLDTYRGFIMLVLVSEAFYLSETARHLAGDRIGDFVDYQLSHAPWTGCSFWDLIQPSFTFMVGVAMPYSYAKRRAKGDSMAKTLAHVIKRSLVLIFLGIFLRSIGRSQTYFTLEDVLTQIGLGYAFVYLVLGKSFRVQMTSLVALLFGYWLAFALYPAPGPGFVYTSVGAGEGYEPFTGFFAHWNKNTNLAHAFDVWFLNLFPRESPFLYNGGGYQTLSFIPSMGTMILGILAGELVKRPGPHREKFQKLVLSGAACIVLGYVLHLTVCPSVKRIWTPSWTVFSGGWTLLMLAAFYWVCDMRGYKRWSLPLLVFGMNSIFMYCTGPFRRFLEPNLKTHFGQDLFSGPMGPTYESLVVTSILGLIGYWMYQRKVFIRI